MCIIAPVKILSVGFLHGGATGLRLGCGLVEENLERYCQGNLYFTYTETALVLKI